MGNRPTLKEISKLTNVSMATVSRALSNPDKVKYATRKRIEKAVLSIQSQMTPTRSGLIGLIIPDVTNQFFPLMLTGIDSMATVNDNTIILCNSNGNPDIETSIIQKLIGIGIDGIIVISTSKVSKQVREIIDNNVVPIIFLDRDPGVEGVSLITTENYEGMYQATKYLLTLGHKNILFLGGKRGVSTNEERFKGYLSALKEILSNTEGSVVYGEFSFSNAYDKIIELIKNCEFNYSAIVCANDVMALGAIKALNESGIRIPEDVSIIGYDDIPSAEYSGLTTVRQPFMEMGRTAMHQLERYIKEPSLEHKKTILPTSIILRDTCSICSDLKTGSLN